LTASSKLWLRSLTIHRYEQFRDCERVEFSPDDNLILGVNGSGKTSLLRLLAAVLRWNYDALLGHPFDIEFEQVLEVDGAETVSIDGRVKNQPALTAVKQQSPRQRIDRSKYEGFEAHFDIHHGSGPPLTVEVRESLIHPTLGDTHAFGDVTPVKSWIAYEIAENLDESRDRADLVGADLPLTACELSYHADDTFMVRETDIDFARLTEHVPYKYSVFADNLVNFEPEDFSDVETRQWYYLIYSTALTAAKQQNGHDSPAPVTYELDAGVGQEGDVSSVLDALNAESISFRLKIEKTENIDDVTRLEGKGVEIEVRFPSGTKLNDRKLTFGQRRLITIGLGALSCGGSPLLVDEIDNGLHPGLVEKTMDLIRGRQTFIASHNKLVVDLLDYENPDDMRRTIHVCRREPDGTQRLIELSEDQVREVFEKIEVGIMHPSDVLIQEGLW
jgi:energy-coupling factor transporter ATP-binding protein EcfA2